MRVEIVWKRLVHDGETCNRCKSTEGEIYSALSKLREMLSVLDIEVILIKEEIDSEDFEKNPLVSNQITINGKLLEDWIGGQSGSSSCCDLCGTKDCRTIEIDGLKHEVVPAELIIKAGLLAATKDNSNCSCSKTNNDDNRCCSS